MNNISFFVTYGSIMGLVGEKGAGKTTTIWSRLVSLVGRSTGMKRMRVIDGVFCTVIYPGNINIQDERKRNYLANLFGR